MRLLGDFDPDQPALLICECSDPGCAESVAVTLRAYREIRRQPGRFLLAAGH